MPVICFSRNVLRAVLSKCLAFVLRLSYVPLGMSCVRSRLLFAACAPNRTACGRVAFLFRRGSGSPFVRSRMSRGYRTWLVHFGLARFFMAIPTENEGTGERGERSRRRGRVRFCVNILALPCFPREVRWGYAPQTAPKSLRLSGLSSRCGGVGLVRIRAVARVHGKTRPALIYGRAGRAVYRWLQHAPTSRLEPPSSGAESGCVREAVWRPHCGYRHCLLCAV